MAGFAVEPEELVGLSAVLGRQSDTLQGLRGELQGVVSHLADAVEGCRDDLLTVHEAARTALGSLQCLLGVLESHLRLAAGRYQAAEDEVVGMERGFAAEP